MLVALSEISKIERYLTSKINTREILDYRINFKFNMDIDVFVSVDANTSFSIKDFHCQFPNSNDGISLEIVSPNDLKTDDLYKSLFERTGKTSKKLLHHRRRLDNQLSFHEYEGKLSIPVITFYSYKGGVGRTTTLAAFAAHYAMHEKKTVVVIDCDFEAPGITNFFGLTPDEMTSQSDENGKESFAKNGVVEYLSDSEFLGEKKVDLENYLIEVSDKYSGEGKICLIPAGNLSASPVTAGAKDTHLDHYLEALARLNISGFKQIIGQFNNLLQHIKDELDPDVILVDSRTGFNDIFANIGLSLSSVVVGFFSSNFQNIPGLNFVLSNPSLIKKLILANSIISSGKYVKELEDLVDAISRVNPLVDEGIANNISVCQITRHPQLENLGTLSEYKHDFIDLIRDKSFPDYVKLFNEIIQRLNSPQQPSNLEIDSDSGNQSQQDRIPIENTQSGEPVETVEVSPETTEGLDERVRLRHDILKTLKSTLDNLFTGYAEQEGSSLDNDNFLRHKFYLRGCMRDLFSKDRFLILGGKGTGKTLLYKTLSTNPNFLELLKEKRNVEGNYRVINVISLQKGYWEDAEHLKYLELTAFKPDDYADGDFFFRRFWQVYTWNAIFLSLAQLNLPLTTPLQSSVLAIRNDVDTRQRFLDLINSDDKMAMIESDLKQVDAGLRQNNTNLILTYDQLDKVIKPSLWSKGIAPLINYWWSNPFSKIRPKLFVRRDLFAKLGNLNNKQSLYTSILMLNLEWRKEEIFGFLFKLVFAYSKTDFFKLMALSGVAKDTVSSIQYAIDKDHQILLDEKYLKPLVNAFFGEWVQTGGYPIATYDWFYKNLCNADKTISLRPFLDLISSAIQNYFDRMTNSDVMNKYSTPILGPRYFTCSEVRKNAVERHFQDLASEEGNEDLIHIFRYIQLHAPAHLRKSFLTTNELKTLFEKVKETYSMEHTSFDDLSSLLINNGIISKSTRTGGYVNYTFAFLYKYYLGLSSKRN
jgi:cellulose biosynthesis protein BcsQ